MADSMQDRFGGHRTVVALFASTLFVSAFLLFWIQPLFGKMVLPLLGGAPNVWITAMLFFQIALLAGYSYAHLAVRLTSLRLQVLLHMAVLGIGVFSLPITIASLGPTQEWPILWLTGIAIVAIGWPLFAVSATAPLIQRWFASGRHVYAADPYFLYAASNLGSIAALLAYPVLLEPFLRLEEQSWGWTGGYGLLIAMTAACGFGIIRARSVERARGAAALPAPTFAVVTWRLRVLWIALSFAPSSLMLGITTHITTDIASAPLLWVIPLVLYLKTFVIAFSRRPILPHHSMVRLQPYILIPGLLLFAARNHWLLFASDIAVFFITALVCHGELVRRRPAPGHLTEFYLLMSLGGLLGGVFNSIIAPIAFEGVYEFAIALVVACMLRPAGPRDGAVQKLILDIALPGLLFGVIYFVRWVLSGELLNHPGLGNLPYIGITAIIVFGFKERSIRFGLGVGAILGIMMTGPQFRVLEQQRSFFGVYSIVRDSVENIHILKHGTTIHGAQKATGPDRQEPLTYYTRQGPVGQVFSSMSLAGRLNEIGVIGLGIGTTICYNRPGQRWNLYEIDPAIVRIARDTRYFHFMSECFDPKTMKITLGDARLALVRQPSRTFDLLVLDAFSSDAVPIHLLTRESLALYRDRLNDGGLILLNVSNQYLDLPPIVGRLIEDAGMHGLVQDHEPTEGRPFHAGSVWILIAREESDLSPFGGDSRWKRIPVIQSAPLWTDDFSNILGAIRPLLSR